MAHRCEGKWLIYKISSADFSTEPPNPPCQLSANQSASSTKNSGKAKKEKAGSPPPGGAGLISSSSGSSVASVRSHFPIGDCLRIQGPATIKTEETEVGPLDYLPPNLMERLERLAYGNGTTTGNPPPLKTYRTEPAQAGDVYRATSDYLRWYSRQYGIQIDQVPTPRSAAAIPIEEQASAGDRSGNWRGKRMKNNL